MNATVEPSESHSKPLCLLSLLASIQESLVWFKAYGVYYTIDAGLSFVFLDILLSCFVEILLGLRIRSLHMLQQIGWMLE